jgi:hypothetical protein
MSSTVRLSPEIEITEGPAMTRICKIAMISGIAALVTACDTMSSGSVENEGEVFDDQQTFGTEPSDPNS